MKKNLFLLSVAALSVSLVVGTAAIIANTEQKMTPGLAGDCTHSHVEHYYGESPAMGNGILEHWACCDCHHAWADEARTILLTDDTIRDRRGLTVPLYGSFLTDDKESNTTLVYDPVRRYAFKCWVTNMNMSGITTIKTVGHHGQLQRGYSLGYYGAMKNRTSSPLYIEIYTRLQRTKLSEFQIYPGEERTFGVSVDDFNAEDEYREQAEWGFTIVARNVYSQTMLGGYIELTSPEVNSNIDEFIGGISNEGGESGFPMYDPIYGTVYSNPVGHDYSYLFSARKLCDTSKYDGVSLSVYNAGDADSKVGEIYCYSPTYECWHPEFKAHQWTEFIIPAGAWNAKGDELGVISFPNIGFGNGYFKFGNFKWIDKHSDSVLYGPSNAAVVDVITTPYPLYVYKDYCSGRVYSDKGQAFSIRLQTEEQYFRVEGKQQIDTTRWNTVEFYIYNDLNTDFTMYSITNDAAQTRTEYGTFKKGEWTKISMTSYDFNQGDMFFYRSGGTGHLLMSYWEAQ
ncbi:MAG: hypothetical protein MJ239_04525 [Bacilli bacterium]|nr:hypothetical protein [Bacilli bacterium]